MHTNIAKKVYHSPARLPIIVYCKIKIQSSATKSAELKAKKKRLASL